MSWDGDDQVLPTTDGDRLTAVDYAIKWALGDARTALEYVIHGHRAPRACTCDEYPEKHWAMTHIELDDPLPDPTIEWLPGDPAYGKEKVW